MACGPENTRSPLLGPCPPPRTGRPGSTCLPQGASCRSARSTPSSRLRWKGEPAWSRNRFCGDLRAVAHSSSRHASLPRADPPPHALRSAHPSSPSPLVPSSQVLQDRTTLSANTPFSTNSKQALGSGKGAGCSMLCATAAVMRIRGQQRYVKEARKRAETALTSFQVPPAPSCGTHDPRRRQCTTRAHSHSVPPYLFGPTQSACEAPVMPRPLALLHFRRASVASDCVTQTAACDWRRPSAALVLCFRGRYYPGSFALRHLRRQRTGCGAY